MPQDITSAPPDPTATQDTNPQQKAAVDELVRRRDSLNDQQKMAVDELARRFKVSINTPSAPTQPQQPQTQTTPPPGGPKPPKESFIHGAARETIGALPAIGATLGGIAGGTVAAPTGAGLPVGAMAGAAVGAGTGETARQLIGHWFPDLTDAPKSNTEAAMGVVTQTALGGTTEGINIAKFLPPWLKKSAAKQIRKVVDPATDIAKGRLLRVEDELASKPSNYLAATRGQLQRRAISKAEDAGQQISKAETAAAGKTRPIQEVQDALDKLKDNLMARPVPKTGGAFQQQPRFDVQDDIKMINQVKGWLSGEEQPGGLISRWSLRALKQDLDAAVEGSTGGYARSALKNEKGEPIKASEKLTKDMATAIRKIMNADEPNIAKLNAEFHLWDSVRKAMAPSTVAEGFARPSSPWRQWIQDRAVAWTAIAAGESYAGISKSPSVALAAGALFAVSEAMRTTAWRTSSAAAKNMLADMLAKGQFEEVAKAATRLVIQSKTGGKSTSGDKGEGIDTSKLPELKVQTTEPPKTEETARMSIEIPADYGGTRNQPAYRNNNPGNLEFRGQEGAEMGEDGRFAKFKTPEEGYRALVKNIEDRKKSGDTLEDYIVRYAPVSENDTGVYITNAEDALGVDGSTPIKEIPTDKLAAFQAKQESGTVVKQPRQAERKPQAEATAKKPPQPEAMTPEVWAQ